MEKKEFKRDKMPNSTSSAFKLEEGEKLTLSSSVSTAMDHLLKAGPISAAALARDILSHHDEYAENKAKVLELEETPRKRPALEWVDEVQTLFDAPLIKMYSKSQQPPILHGRLMIVGLCLLEPQLRQQLERGEVFDALKREIQEPIDEILTERGRKMMWPTEPGPSEPSAESVPNLPDDPLLRQDQDQLGRAAFAQFLEGRIREIPSDSGAFSIHVYGPWGSGKSTLLNFIHSDLEKTGDWLVADFNAWRHQHIDLPWWSLMESVFEQTKQGLNWRKRLREYLWRFNIGRLDYLIYLIALIVLAWIVAWFVFPYLSPSGAASNRLAGINTWATPAEHVSKILAAALTIWGIIVAISRSLLMGSAKAAQSYMELTRDPMDGIKKRFNTLIKRLKPKRVAVFIDDLDRCQSKYAVQLLEGIQTLFRDAPVIFVIAADFQWLNACYEETYDKLKPFVCQPGKELGVLFLEKAFQFSTPVPGIPKELKEMYWQTLIRVTPQESESIITEARKQAKAKMAEALSEGSVIRLINDSRNSAFHEQRAIREAAVIRLAAPEVVKRTEHALKPFVGYLEPNPRSMKRLVNAYSVNRALATLSHIDVERDRLALWTILSLRWPSLADYLEKNPELVGDIVSQKFTNISPILQDLCQNRDVKAIIEGGPTEIALNAEVVRNCTLLRGY